MRQKRYDRKLSKHHIKPRSRNGDNSERNLVYWDETYHRAYHVLFSNLTLQEAIQMLIITSTATTQWDRRKLEELRIALKGEEQ